MYIGIALLCDLKIQNIKQNISLSSQLNYSINNLEINLPSHISLKQSFPYDGDINELETNLKFILINKKLPPIKLIDTKLIKINNSTSVLWFNVQEQDVLRRMHNDLCTGLKEKFNIDPLGFDGKKWRFHSTVIYANNSLDELTPIYEKYKDLYRNIDMNVNNFIMFCSLGNNTLPNEYFTYKIF